ncbi:hypothetical protein FIV42_15490 [Persicimonas caeni]|uniref:Restriction endonuclease n=1 Tax=Persicimonas caeni TaxID=2292766 RepID=A0A4Y6PWI1_PERCE|nr:DUF6339 family protein [Persicimonas caeni]QDG52095.1 hypothetical protein FIV42_15490 [Persicimonas caeni]QED33316.1 hypothetical protein FRD00_15485 [Persicimonas caeni]
MTLYLFPRLQKGNAKLWAERFHEMSPEQVAEARPRSDIDGVLFAPTGGPKVTDDILREFRQQVIEAAKASGYPDQRFLEGQRQFDLELARILLRLPIIPGEALRDEVWQYLTCKLVPEAVVWRFGSTKSSVVTGPTTESRFLGGNRNLLQRLWWRATILRDPTADDEVWLLDTSGRGLTEDNMVALLERGNIAGYHDLCRSIATEFIKYRPYVEGLRQSPEEHLLREVMKRVVRRAAFANLDAVAEEDRLETIRGLFVETIEAMGGNPPSPGRIYDKIAVRHLRPIDLPNSSSNQHEIQGVTALRQLLGEEEQQLDCHWRLFWKDGSVRKDFDGRVKWYDARASSPRRSEWRLYYPAGTPLEEAEERDMLVLATSLTDDQLHAFVLPRGAPISLQIRGALGAAEGVNVPDEVEEFVREKLHERL